MPDRQTFGGTFTKNASISRRAAAFAFIPVVLVAPAVLHAEAAEPAICRQLKALGYDETKELPLLIERYSKRELCIRRFWQRYQPKPLNKILNQAERTRYQSALKLGINGITVDEWSRILNSAVTATGPSRHHNSRNGGTTAKADGYAIVSLYSSPPTNLHPP